MEISKSFYKNLLEDLGSVSEYEDSINLRDNTKKFERVLIQEVLERIENGDIYPYDDFKSLSIELQVKLFLLFDKDFNTSQIANKWGISENTVYQWRHRVKRFIGEYDSNSIQKMKNELSLLRNRNDKLYSNKDLNEKYSLNWAKEDFSISDPNDIVVDLLKENSLACPEEIIENDKVIKEKVEDESEDSNIFLSLNECPAYLLKDFLDSIIKIKKLDDNNKKFNVSITIKEIK